MAGGKAFWQPLGGAGGASALDDLTDVATAGAADGDVLTFDSATTSWAPAAPPAGGGGGGMTLIAEVTRATVGTIAFASIPATYSDLFLSGQVRVAAPAGVFAELGVRLGNGAVDTAANYRHFNRYDGTSAGNAISNAASASRVGNMPGTDATTGVFASFELRIHNYATAGTWRFMNSRIGYTGGNGSWVTHGWGAWMNTASVINTVSLREMIGSTDNLFEVGSFAHLYGVG